MQFLWLIPILPALAVAYAIIARPLLSKITSLQTLYAEADGFWAKIWAMCDKSATMVWGYILGGIGVALSALDPIAQAIGDPTLGTQITNLLQGHPQWMGYFTIGASVITLIARLRSLSKVP